MTALYLYNDDGTWSLLCLVPQNLTGDNFIECVIEHYKDLGLQVKAQDIPVNLITQQMKDKQ